MKLPLLSTLLVAIILLLSSSGCSKKEAATPAPAIASNTGSYKLDGQLVTCSQVAVYEYPNRWGKGADELQIQLLTPATTQAPGENMLLDFTKAAGAPVSDYFFVGVTHIIWMSTGPQTRSFNTSCQFTLAATASGGYTGTFSCTSPSFGSLSASQLTEGVFTDVHP